MKAKLITLATASALAIPMGVQAQDDEGASWYGSIRTSLGYYATDDAVSNGTVSADVDDSHWAVNDHSSRIGVKGANDLGSGLKVPYRFEFKADSDEAKGIEGGRLGRIGLQGGFGAIHIGQLWSPYYNYLGQYTDVFNTVGVPYYDGGFRLSNALRYDLPSTGGFSGQIAVQADGDAGKDDIDAFNVGIGYNTDAFGVAMGYVGDRVGDDKDKLGITAGASFSGFDLGLLYEDYDSDDDARIHAVLSFGAGSNTYRIGYSDFGSLGAFQLGWQHKLGKASRVAVELQKGDLNTSFTVTPADGGEAVEFEAFADSTALNFFIRTDF